MSSQALTMFNKVVRALSLAVLLVGAAPVHAVVFDNHWDGDWNLTTGLIAGTFFVDTLPFPMVSHVVNTNINEDDWLGSGGDSLHLTYVPDSPNPPPFGGFTQYSGTFTIVSGTGHYAGATGGGNYIAFSIPDPQDSNILKTSGFNHGEINIVPEPSTNALLVGGVGVLALMLRARRRKA